MVDDLSKKKYSSLHEKDKSWQEAATSLQQTFCETIGDCDWDSYEDKETDILCRKVGHAIFGPPTEITEIGYDAVKMTKIKHVTNVIMEQSEHYHLENERETWMAIIFVCMKQNGNTAEPSVTAEPVFRVPKYSEKGGSIVAFIDSNGRSYKSWNDYLQNNKLPACSYCYPTEGIYQLNVNQQVCLDFGQSPASRISSKIYNFLDHATTAVAVGSLGISMAFPVTAPVISVSAVSSTICSLYGVGRNANDIVDRHRHGETIGLKSVKSRNCWLSLLGNTVGAISGGSTRILTRLMKTGDAVGRTGKACAIALNVTSCTVNGINVINDILNLNDKRKVDELSSLDVAKLISSIIFFGHSVVNANIAVTILKDGCSEENYITNIRSNKYKKVFIKNDAAVSSENNSGGLFRIIRSVKYINELEKTIFIPVDNRQILNSTNLISSLYCHKDLILKGAHNLSSWIRSKDLKFNVAVGRKWSLIFSEVGNSNVPLLLNLASKFFDEIQCPGVKNICDILSLIFTFIRNTASEMESLYWQHFENEKRLAGIDFCASAFDESYGISGKRLEHFYSVILNSASLITEIFSLLMETFKSFITEKCDIKNKNNLEMHEEIIPWSFSDSKSCVLISDTEARMIATTITHKNIHCKNSIVSYAESAIFVIIEDKSVEFSIVKITCCVEESKVIASVMQ